MIRTTGQLLVLWFAAAILAVPGTAQEVPGTGPAITWRVENPFRFFADAADTAVHRATYRSLSASDRLQHPILASEDALSLRHEGGWAATMFQKVCWDPKTNRFVCPNGNDYINPSHHGIVANVSGINEASLLDCTWLTAPHGDGTPRGVALKQPCNERVRLDIPYPDGATLTVEIGGREVARETIRVRDLLIVGMGDSFASGEGNPDVPVHFSRERSASYGEGSGGVELSGYPARIGPWRQIGDDAFIEGNARWSDQACHRSLYSYQLRAALQLAIEEPHRAVTYIGIACSGADVIWGLFLRYTGNEWVPNPPDHSQISAISEAQCGNKTPAAHDLPEAYHMKGAIPELKGGLMLRKCDPLDARKIDLLMLSIGGNDVGFSRLIANAVLADQSLLRKMGGWFGQVHGHDEASTQLAGLNARYKSLNRAFHHILHIPWSESDRIVLTGYPALALLGDGSEVCPDGRAGMDVLSDFKMSESKARTGMWIADKLHQEMETASRQNGWTFVDRHRREFVGRGICAGTTHDGAHVFDDLRLPRKTKDGWRPYNPEDFRAYAPRQRWLRTPNDAFMTGNFHVAGSMLQKVLKLDALAWFQLVLASTYSGAFHPTAQGHAAVADAVVHTVRGVLDKYENGEDQAATWDLNAGPAEAATPTLQ